MNEPIWFQNLVAYSLQMAVVALVGSALPYLLKLRAPRIMLAYWQALAAACLVLPVLQPWRVASTTRSAIAGDIDIQISMGPATHETAWLRPATAILIVLMAGILARLGWLAIGSRRLRGYRRRARLITTLPEGLRQIRRAIPTSVTFCLSDEISVPATFGRVDPVILLPKRFLEMDEDRQCAIACHELLHVARSDWSWNMAEELVLAILWFHPAAWWLASRIRLAREQVVDREVIRLTRKTKPYLHALLEIAREATGRHAAPAPLFLGEGQLAQRVSLMVKEVAMSRKRLVASMIAASVALIFSGCLAVWAFPLRMPPAAQVLHATEDAEQVEGGLKGGIPGGVAGGVVGSVPGGIEGGLKGGVQDSSKRPHHVNVRQLKVAHKVQPVYPPLAKQASVQGDVILDITVEKDGSVSDIKVVSGHPMLAKSAIDAVKEWRYEPSPELPARTQVTIHFTLSDGKPSKQQGSASLAPVVVTDASYAQHDEVQAGKVYRIGKDVKAPVAMEDPDPPYTPEAKKAKLSGTGVFNIIVDERGNVTSVVETSKPLGKGLDQRAIDTLRTWKFRPASRDGQPVAVGMRVEVSFRFF